MISLSREKENPDMKSTFRLAASLLLVVATVVGCHPALPEPNERDYASPVRQWGNPSSEASATDSANVTASAISGARVYEIPPDPELPYARAEVRTDPAHSYTLPELIDLAQRNNPATRIAWERARQAAHSVGLVESTYLPQLSAMALGGVQTMALPIPKTLDAKGYFTTDANEILPSLTVRWLLFDFGQRNAKADAARQVTLAAKADFTGAHQRLILEVSRAYFALDAVRAQLHLAERVIKNAELLQQSTEAKLARGLATTVEVATARKATAKARFRMEQAHAADNDAYHTLLEKMGLPPTLRLKVASSIGRPLPSQIADDVDQSIQMALSRRPEIATALAQLRASQAGLKAAKAEYFPKVGLEGIANQNIGAMRVNSSDYYSVNRPTASVLLKFELPLFDGGLRESENGIARSKVREARTRIAKTQNEIMRQVARAHDDLNSALAQHKAAIAYAEAAEKEATSTLEAYRLGVGTFTAAQSAETDSVQAQSGQAQAYSQVLDSAASLAFATGALTSGNVLEQGVH
jgi:outer membrane protein TolC